jgi:hypothetical protein
MLAHLHDMKTWTIIAHKRIAPQSLTLNNETSLFNSFCFHHSLFLGEIPLSPTASATETAMAHHWLWARTALPLLDKTRPVCLYTTAARIVVYIFIYKPSSSSAETWTLQLLLLERFVLWVRHCRNCGLNQPYRPVSRQRRFRILTLYFLVTFM